MASIRQRNNPVRLFWRRLLVLVLIVIVMFGIWAVWGVYQKERESSARRQQAEAQLKDLSARAKNLTASIGTLETERGQEEALRDAYEVGKAGEGMVLIVDQAPTSTPQVSEPEPNLFRRIFWWW